jgi:predicted nucleotidyltransferase
MSEQIEAARILVVGASGGAMSAAIVRELLRRGYDVREASEDDIVVFKDELVPQHVLETIELLGHVEPRHIPMVEQYIERTPPHGWYQQFNGRRRRPPRY